MLRDLYCESHFKVAGVFRLLLAPREAGLLCRQAAGNVTVGDTGARQPGETMRPAAVALLCIISA